MISNLLKRLRTYFKTIIINNFVYLKELREDIDRNSHEINVLNQQLDRNYREINVLNQQLKKIEDTFESLPITKLALLLKEVDHYQPIYKIPSEILQIHKTSRICEDRCKAIEDYFNSNVTSLRLLDVGSSLGYNSFYFADRGSIVRGIDNNILNTQVSTLAQEINGIRNADFRFGEFNQEYVDLMQENEYDVVLLLSVIHHIITFKGLDYVQDLMNSLLEKVPVIIVELATVDEPVDYPWRSCIPKDELEIFAKCQNIDIQLIGKFSNHLSSLLRPLYVITKNSLFIKDKVYRLEKVQWSSYDDSVGKGRRYFHGHTVLIKQYITLGQNIPNLSDNQEQIICEVANYLNLAGRIKGIPKLIDYEIGKKYTFLIFEKIPGRLLRDILPILDHLQKAKIVHDLLRILSALEKEGLYHNDIRTWNIMVSNEETYLIDLGLTSPLPKENNLFAFLWILWCLHHEIREGSEPNKGMPSDQIDDYGADFATLASIIIQNQDVTFTKLLDSFTLK